MTRHLIDTPRDQDTMRLARFLRIARQNGLHKARDMVARREPLRGMARVVAYSRIARGRAV